MLSLVDKQVLLYKVTTFTLVGSACMEKKALTER